MFCKHCLVLGGWTSRYCDRLIGRQSHVYVDSESEEGKALIASKEIRFRIQSEFECPSCGMGRPGLTEEEQREELAKPCGNPECPSHRVSRSLSDDSHYGCEDAPSMDSVFGFAQGTLRMIERLEEVADGHGFARPSMALGAVLWRLVNKQPAYRMAVDRELSEIVVRNGGRDIEVKVRLFPRKSEELKVPRCKDCHRPLTECVCDWESPG